MDDSVGRAELSRLLQFLFSCGEVKAALFEDWLELKACVVHRWIMFMTLDYF